MTVSELPENEAEAYRELACPDCLERSVIENEKISKQYEEDYKKLIYAGKCNNPECGTDQINPTHLKPQVKTEATTSEFLDALEAYFTGLGKESKLPTFSLILTVVLAGAILGATVLSGGGQGSEAELTVENPGAEPMGTTLALVNSSEGWDIYNVRGNYVVTGVVNDSQRYLNPDGEPITSPYGYDRRPDSKQAILNWYAKHDHSQAAYPRPEGSDRTNVGANWTLYQTGSQYFIAGTDGENIKYVTQSGDVADKPTLFDAEVNATRALTLSATTPHKNISRAPARTVEQSVVSSGFETSCSPWSYRDWSLAVANGGYYILGESGNGTAYLGIDGSINQDPIVYSDYGNVTTALSEWQNTANGAGSNVSPTTKPPSLSEINGTSYTTKCRVA